MSASDSSHQTHGGKAAAAASTGFFFFLHSITRVRNPDYYSSTLEHTFPQRSHRRIKADSLVFRHVSNTNPDRRPTCEELLLLRFPGRFGNHYVSQPQNTIVAANQHPKMLTALSVPICSLWCTTDSSYESTAVFIDET